MRDHPLMENSVTAAPLLVRKGTKYTKLAVTKTGREVELSGTVLHLGTGEERWKEPTYLPTLEQQKSWTILNPF